MEVKNGTTLGKVWSFLIKLHIHLPYDPRYWAEQYPTKIHIYLEHVNVALFGNRVTREDEVILDQGEPSQHLVFSQEGDVGTETHRMKIATCPWRQRWE